MLLVVMILGILATGAVVAVSGMRTEAAESSCDADRRQLAVAAEAFFAQAPADRIAPTGDGNDRYEQTLADGGFLRAVSAYHDLDADGIVDTQEDSPC
jgi:type II secretory pathway pseudopilin PulG